MTQILFQMENVSKEFDMNGFLEINNKETLEKCKEIIFDLEKIYETFFIFEKVFSTDSNGKTRLNNNLIDKNNELIKKKVDLLKKSLEDLRNVIINKIKEVLESKGFKNKSNLTNLIYDDTNFLELLKVDLESKNIVDSLKNELLKELEKLIEFKNKIYNLKYLINMFDTKKLANYIAKLGTEELINNQLIFEIIDTYSLQYNKLKKFEFLINNLEYYSLKISNFMFLDSILTLHKRRLNNYLYLDNLYKIQLNYEIEINLKKKISFNTYFLENIISNFIEQSCLDLIKKEFKKGKIQKYIDVQLNKRSNSLEIIITNNGFGINDVNNLFMSENENKCIIEARNLARMINAQIQIESIEAEEMKYIITIKTN